MRRGEQWPLRVDRHDSTDPANRNPCNHHLCGVRIVTPVASPGCSVAHAAPGQHSRVRRRMDERSRSEKSFPDVKGDADSCAARTSIFLPLAFADRLGLGFWSAMLAGLILASMTVGA